MEFPDAFPLETDAQTFLNYLKALVKVFPELAKSWDDWQEDGSYRVLCGFPTSRKVKGPDRLHSLRFLLLPLSDNRVLVSAFYEGEMEESFKKVLKEIYDSYPESRESLGPYLNLPAKGVARRRYGRRWLAQTLLDNKAYWQYSVPFIIAFGIHSDLFLLFGPRPGIPRN